MTISFPKIALLSALCCFILLTPGISNAQIVQHGFSFGSPFSDFIWGVDYDKSGNVYVTGYFSGTIDLDPSAGVFELESGGFNDGFVAKYSRNGALIWGFSYKSGDNGGGGRDIGVDAEGNVYVVAQFAGEIDIDPGPDEYMLSTTRGFQNDFLLAKYTRDGALLWGFNIGGDRKFEYVDEFHVDDSGNVYLGGILDDKGDYDLDPGPGEYVLTNIGNDDAFVAKYSKEGELVTAFNIGGRSPGEFGFGGDSVFLRGIDVDIEGNIYIACEFYGKVDVDPGEGKVEIKTGAESFYENAFIAKYSSDGSLRWAVPMKSIEQSVPRAIKVDADGNVIVTGVFQDAMDFDPSPKEYILEGGDVGNIFLAKYNDTGELKWAFGLDTNATSGAQNRNLAVDSEGNIIVDGNFVDSVDLDPGLDETVLTTTENSASFLAMYSQAGDLLWGYSGVSFGDMTLIGDRYLLGAGPFRGEIDIDLSENEYLLEATPIPSGEALSIDAFIVRYDLGARVTSKHTPGAEERLELQASATIDSNELSSSSYPNPFNPATTIRFNLPESSSVLLKIFDVTGRSVKTLVNGSMDAGAHDVIFDAGHLPSGLYLYRLYTEQGTLTRKLFLSK